MKKYALFSFCLIFFGIFIFLFLFPFKIEAKELTQEEIDRYIQLPETDARNILRSLPQILTNQWIDSVVSVSSAEQEGIVVIMRKAIRGDMMDYFLREAPKELSKEAIRIGFQIWRLAYTSDISALFKEIEKMTVSASLRYLGQWLKENETKISFGNIDFSYDTLAGGEAEHQFQYIIIYSPQTKQAVIKIYSANPMAPPASRGSLGAISGTGWNYSQAQAQGKQIPQFILSINGEMKRKQAGFWSGKITHKYTWVGRSRTDIEFPNNVSRFDFHKKGFIERIKDKVKNFFSDVTNNFANFFSASMVKPSFDESDSSKESESEQSDQTLQEILDILKLVQGSLSDLEYKYLQQLALSASTGQDFNDLLKKLQEIQFQIDNIGQPSVQQEEIIEILETEIPETGPQGIVVNEVCVGMDSSKNEFIELYNPSNSTVSLKDDNFQIQLVSSGNNSTKKKLDWKQNTIPSKGYFLFVGGELVVNNKKIEPDAIFSSQLSGISGVIISDKEGNILDKVSWGSTSKSPPALAVETKGKVLAGGLKTGESLERTSHIDTNNNSTDFSLSQSPSPTNSKGETQIYKKPVSTGGGSSGGSSAASSDDGVDSPSPKILISEIQIEQETKILDFIELYNPSSGSADISSWRLKKKNQNGTESSIRVFPAGSIIASKGYFLWASSKEEDYPASIGADVVSSAYLTENESIALLDQKQEIIDALAWGTGHSSPFVETPAFNNNPETRDVVGEWFDEIGFTGTRTPYPCGIFYQSLGRKVSASNGEQDFDNNLNDFELQNPTPKAENETFIEPILQDILNEIDSTPPETEITSNPPILTNQTQAIFSFEANEEGCSFECKLDSQNWGSCETPKTYTDCSEGEHQFLVRATDLFLNIESEPAEYTWTIDTAIESPTISLFDLDTGSEFYTNQRTVGASISAPGSELGLEWLLSENSEKPAVSSQYWQAVKPETFILSESEGSKTVYIWTKDGAGNISVLGNSSSIILDTLAPCSHVADLEEIQTSVDFNVSWSGSDATGIAYYDIQIKDSLIDVWQDWQNQTNEVNIQFTVGEDGHTYYFRARAEDLAGNLEDWPDSEQGDTFTLIDLSGQDDNGQDDNGQDDGQDAHGQSTSTNSLLITEIRADGIEEFVELYNPLEQGISLEGLYLSYFSEARNWNEPYINKLFLTSTIPSQEYYLIGFGDYPGGEEPDPDWSPDTRNLSNNNGSVGIFSCNPKNTEENPVSVAQAEECKIDALGWGSVLVKEGQAISSAEDGKSLARKLAPDASGYLKYVDTNDNSADFEDQDPTPKAQNYSSYLDLDNDGILDSYDSLVLISSDAELAAGEYSFQDLVISNGANLVLRTNLDLEGFKGVKISAQNLTIEENCSLNSDFQGYLEPETLEKNFSVPETLGSGGQGNPQIPGCSARPGGIGGGAMILEISNTLEVQGRISVNGQDGMGSGSYNCFPTVGGDGGSAHISTNILQGSGEFLANGGNNDDWKNGLGKGGQIAVYYQDKTAFSGVIYSFSGEKSGNYTSPGTVYWEKANMGRLKIQAQGKTAVFEVSDNLTNLGEIEISNVTMSAETSINFEALDFVMDSALLEAPALVFLNFWVSDFSLNNSEIRANVDISGQNIIIDTDSSILADEKGYASDTGPGTGSSGKGGSYGGAGGKNATTSVYGSQTEPTDFGSGGGGYPAVEGSCYFRSGGSGGGAVILDASNKIKHDGIISVNGKSGTPSPSYGCVATPGGSGGSVYIIADSLEGSGTIRANGGESGRYSIGAGGGGRIAVHGNRAGFSGIIQVFGGENGLNSGQEGTVYLNP